MNQRSHIRHQAEIAATVTCGDHTLNNCRIQNFCLGGILLYVQPDYEVQLASLVYDDLLEVTLQVTGLRGLRKVSLKARVRRKEGYQLGLSFDAPDSTALLAVQNHVRELAALDNSAASNVPKMSAEAAYKASEALHDVLKGFILQKLKLFFPAARNALIAAADKAHNNQAQQPYFQAEKAIGAQAETLARSFVSGASKKLFDMSRGHGASDDMGTDASSRRLSLVDQEVFEDWLTLKVMATRAEGRFHEDLLHLQLRLDQLFNIALSMRKNPLHPAVICTAFGEALRLLPLKQRTDRVILAAFQDTVVDALGEFYASANQSLAQMGILPDLDAGRYISENYGPKRSPALDRKPKQAKAKETSETNPEIEVEKGEETKGFEASKSAAAKTKSEESVAVAPSKNKSRTQSRAKLAERQFTLQQHIARHAYETVRNLLSKSSYNAARKRLAEPNQSLPYVDDVKVEETLSQLQREVRDEKVLSADLLSDRIDAAINTDQAEPSQLNENVRTSVDVIQHLFEGILANPALSENTKEAIKRLELPFLRLLLIDEQFLIEETHPARQVLNRMSHLGVRGSANLASHEKEIKNEVANILDRFDTDVDLFKETLGKLEKLASWQQSVYVRNIKRVTESCEGRQKLQSAKKEVNQALERRIGGKQVPRAVLSLVDAGWRQLLTQALLRHGRDSREWHRYLGVIDQMLKAVEVVPGKEALSSLLATIKSGLEQVDHTQMQNARLISELRDLLSKKTRSEAAPEMVNVPPGVLGADLVDNDIASDELTVRWIKRAQRYEEGDWFSYSDNNQESMVRLAWLDPSKSSFVFVNHQGMKIVELRVDAFAQKLSRGEISPIDNLDAPAVDRGLENMVKRVYGQMAHHATHDELTGLLNRREFERQMKKALSTPEFEACLLHIDIDQFKVVNNFGGPKAGDELIAQLAEVLAATFPKDLVARLNGDEYAVLLSSASTEAAKDAAESLREKISSKRFICAEKPYSITLSVGIADVETAVTGAELLRASSSACLAAKESGRNRVQIYTDADEGLAKQNDVMAWIARLNDAIDNDRLLLRCQRIEATDAKDQKPSYEVLISIKTAEGDILAPAEFLHAAERYNRMHALDRWVVSNVLRWMHENPNVVNQLDHLSINLSGHSLNDENLLEFLLEHFQRYPVPRERICFEVTETAAIANLEDATDLIHELQDYGCRFSLDDFGSGLASYAYLKRLPVDYIKIDGSFIRGVAEDPADLALVRSINEMGHLMGKRTIAEYVENDRIRECMSSIGVDYVQGYGVEKPRTLDSLISSFS